MFTPSTKPKWLFCASKALATLGGTCARKALATSGEACACKALAPRRGKEGAGAGIGCLAKTVLASGLGGNICVPVMSL